MTEFVGGMFVGALLALIALLTAWLLCGLIGSDHGP